MTKLNQLTIVEALQGFRERKFSVLELVQAVLNRIKDEDKKINAYVTVNKEEILKKAGEADKNYSGNKYKNKALLGIPLAVKDNFCTRDLRTTASSLVLDDFLPPFESTVTRKLEDAGAIIIGKTNMDAWAHGSSTETSDYGPTLNPWNLNTLPGGSSGGSAAAVSADETIAAIGSETAGSIRQPASWCGVVGLKPTYGRVSRYGVIAMASSTDSPGPLTKTVRDASYILKIIAGNDPKDATTAQKTVPDYPDIKPLSIKKIGFPKEYFGNGVDKEIKKAVEEALKIFEKKGISVKEISLFDPKYAISVYTILQRSEVSSNLARYDGIRYGNDRRQIHDEAKRRIMLGTYTLSAGYYDAYYLQAQKIRTLICEDFEKAFNDVDLIIGPSCPSTALEIGASEKNPMFGELQDVFFEPSSIAGLPGISLPCGFSKSGMPIGMQIMGPQFSEENILSAAFAYEQETDWHKRKPKI